MKEILKDPIWQFVGVIIAVTALIISIILFFIQRKIKKLSYSIISSNEVVSIKDKYSENLKIFYKDSIVKNVSLVIIKFSNNGSIPINANDFNSEIFVTLEGDSTKLLAGELMETSPEELELLFRYSETQINILPTLINQKDTFTFKLLIDNYHENIKVSGRIAGIKSIKETKKNIMLYSWFPYAIGLAIGGALISAVNIFFSNYFIHIMFITIVLLAAASFILKRIPKGN